MTPQKRKLEPELATLEQVTAAIRKRVAQEVFTAFAWQPAAMLAAGWLFKLGYWEQQALWLQVHVHSRLRGTKFLDYVDETYLVGHPTFWCAPTLLDGRPRLTYADDASESVVLRLELRD